MKYPLFLFLFIALFSCDQVKEENGQSEASKHKLDSLHSSFNDIELTKEFIALNKDTVTIVTFGHVYSLLYHEDVFDSMIRTINAQDPDYVWILGDIVFNNAEEEWDYILEKYKGIKAKRFHAGGNHDMNYHYERYYGIRENQWEAETRFLNKIGYRYITIEDDLANYMMINMNDSLDRIESYLDKMLPLLNPDKPSILFTHHCTWHKTISKADDSKTWVKKSFQSDSILAVLTDFDYLIHGDWSENYFSGVYGFHGKRFNTIGVGNLKEGDSLYVTTVKITQDTLWSYPVFVEIPDTTTWKAKSP